MLVGLATWSPKARSRWAGRTTHAIQARELKDTSDPLVGSDQLDGAVVVVVCEQAPMSADQLY
jgi:hypothetical protein